MNTKDLKNKQNTILDSCKEKDKFFNEFLAPTNLTLAKLNHNLI